ncbi:hypothetical protein BDP27DRAFT_1323778 [Rhodocollybia butyracea]|uniref:Uncharacterized protein n=1 Tax=Rhodocollybia butyracea TaxID=206335 RepID=A0A9P5PWQ6_9AGAR|nr:hypothetical protein BDP27DRAFT_1323778 [Rhodocollybia butyracea]
MQRYTVWTMRCVYFPRANLNKEYYFTNRKDRYPRFTGQAPLSDYCFDFLRKISTFSYQAVPADTHTDTTWLLICPPRVRCGLARPGETSA